MNRIRICIFLMMGLLSTLTAVASTPSVATNNSHLNSNLLTLTDIEHQISTEKNNYLTLKRLKNQLIQMNSSAKVCITKANQQIEKIEKMLGYLSAGSNTTINEYNTLLNQDKAISKQKLAECSFISYRSEEIILLIQSEISTLKLPANWIRSHSIWELIQNTSFSSLKNTPLSEQNITLFKELTTTAILLLIFFLTWIVLSLDYIKNRFSHTIQIATKWSLASVYSILIALYLAGYHHFAMMLIPKLAISGCVSIIAFQLIRGISRLQHAFDVNETPLAKNIHTFFGFGHHEASPELVMIRTILYLAIVSWSSVVLLHLWGLPDAYRDQLITTAFHGIPVFGFTIYPVRIIRAVMLFFILMLLGRIFSNAIMQGRAFKNEKHLQLTISTLIRYATFIIATVLSFFIAGISFTGIAIAVGALLVGVGFGLQQIVSDFIAGLILLSNNVMRPGDYVKVNDTEGTVMKIRLLATEVKGKDPMVLLVPNSFFIGKSVSNYTYQGHVYNGTIKFVIEQMSDIRRAEKVILDAAANNTKVINNNEHKPYTRIESTEVRGYMCIKICLFFPIAIASEQDAVSTELNYAILDAFQMQNINNHTMQFNRPPPDSSPIT